MQDTQSIERAYAEEVIAWLRSRDDLRPSADPFDQTTRGAGSIAVVKWWWEGLAPNSELKIVFTVPGRACLFGVVDLPWHQDGGALGLYPDSPGEAATNSIFGWLARVTTGLPRKCSPDINGITWLPLWDED